MAETEHSKVQDDPEEDSGAYRLGRWFSSAFTRPGWMISALRGTAPDNVASERHWASSLIEETRRALGSPSGLPSGSPLQRVFQRLAETAPVPGWEFSLAWYEANAPAWVVLPGGYLFASRSMMAWTRTPEVFGFFLAHEMAHLMLRHTLRRWVWDKSLGAVGKVPVLGKKPAGLQARLKQGYTLEQELEADQAAARHCVLARIPLSPAIDFLADQRDDARHLPPVLQYHPPFTTRIQVLDRMRGGGA